MFIDCSIAVYVHKKLIKPEKNVDYFSTEIKLDFDKKEGNFSNPTNAFCLVLQLLISSKNYSEDYTNRPS